MSNFKISRRHFITSAGVVFTLPLLESLFPFSKAMAQSANDPRRFVALYFPNGTYNRADKPIWWTPPGAITDANTSIAYSPFAANYGDILNINNLMNDAYWTRGGDDHEGGATTFLTCSPVINSSITSFEHLIADKVGKNALVLSGGATSSDLFGDQFISYRNGVGSVGTSNPGDLYRSLFRQVVPSAPTVPGTTDATKSILDSSIEDFKALTATLSKADRPKMDEFLTSIRTLESRMIANAPSPVLMGSCNSPVANPAVDSSDTANSALYFPKLYAMNDLIKIAFACDVTRSVSIMLDQETTGRTFAPAPSNLIYQGTDISGGQSAHLPISHASGQTDVGYKLAATRDRCYMNVVVDLVNKLKSSNDPSGSRILDNTIIMAGFGVLDGNHEYEYKNDRRPLLLAGGRNMITPGISHTLTGSRYKDLMYTIATKLGVGLPNFAESTTLLKI